jgi:hypothetical protein
VESTDGFYISEMDLKLRGRASSSDKQADCRACGSPTSCATGDPGGARRDAVDFVERPPSPEELKRAVAYIRDHWQRRYGLVTVG